ncbi:hypothetical protein D0T84_19065 [Dysgonomonas sp. 521]|uniref:hypothetical protein n=1 Tax=Dysgonomonas sp. 521 TaxID=2302932 RepID=UPI0013D12F79|nr:hypothetical protein [Dysgonomonas sp. 521]NDV96991.1 hypothetical protein [Dysgonomonas sp. 521]
MLELIKENQVLITLLFSGIVMLSTVVYAILTWKLVTETKQMRVSQYEPYIMFYLSKGETITEYLFLNIINVGQGVARDVKFEILKDPMFKDSKITDNSFFEQGVKYFPPNKNYRHFLGSWQGLKKDEILSRSLAIKVSYKDIFRKGREETFSLSFSDTEIDGKFTPPETYIGMISYELKKIDTSIQKLNSSIIKASNNNQ